MNSSELTPLHQTFIIKCFAKLEPLITMQQSSNDDNLTVTVLHAIYNIQQCVPYTTYKVKQI